MTEEPGETEAAAATRATLNRKKRSRVGHRASATRLINQATTAMEDAEVDTVNQTATP